MTINYSEKIEKINNDRILMLNTVKENITKNNISLFDNLNNIISTLNEDEKNTKKYKSILKAKQFIFELTEQIMNAGSIEEITNLRKKINYYINKIKKELENRNINQELFEKMYDSVEYLRTDFKRYISFFKRKTNITKISTYYENIDNLSIESIKELKKLLLNETRYNKRYMTSVNHYQKNDSKNIKKKSLPSTNSDKVLLEKQKEQVPLTLSLNLLTVSNDNNNIQTSQITKQKDDKDLTQKIDRYLSLYQFSKITSYDGNFFKKCATFLKNIPKYRFNRKIINYAERDYNIYYHGDDLANFIDYLKKYNSIQLALELIFRKSSLSEREIECLFEHNKCVDWITEFCNQENYLVDNNPKLIRSK